MKKYISLLMLPFILLASSPLVQADFSDVTPYYQFYEAVSYVETKGIVSGHPDGTFKPSDPIDRAAFTKIIVEAQFTDEEIESCGSADFSDIEEGVWFDKYVCVAQKNNVIDGYPDGTFRAANEINLVEAAKIIAEAFGHQVQEDAVWYKPYVMVLEQENAIPTTFIGFDQNVTRGEMAAMVYRLHAGVTTEESTTYAYLEQGIDANDLPPELDMNKTEFDDYLEFLDHTGSCVYVKNIDFTHNEQYDVHYGAFTWTGKVVSMQDEGDENTDVYLTVAEDDTLAVQHFKTFAELTNNNNIVRFIDGMVYFQLGGIENEAFMTYAQDVSDEAKAAIEAAMDSEEEITLDLAIPFYGEGGGGGSFGYSFSCYMAQ